MRFSMHALMALLILLVPSATEPVDQKPTEILAAIKKEGEAVLAEVRNSWKPGTAEAEQKKALERYHNRITDLGPPCLGLGQEASRCS